MNIASWLGQWAILCWTIIFVHECGHYGAARLAGASKGRVRIRMLFFPPHVALLDGKKGWLAPWQQPEYGQLCREYFRGNRSAIIRYVGAGLIVQALFVFLGAWMLFLMGWHAWAFNLPTLSVQITTIYFLIEAAAYLYRKKPFGDFTGLWLLSKRAFCTVSAAVVILHGLAFLVFYLRP